MGKQQSQGATQDKEQHAFSEQLTDYSSPAGTQCGAHGNLLSPRTGSREQKIGRVGAGDEQKQSDRTKENKEQRIRSQHPVVAPLHDIIEERLHPHSMPSISGGKLHRHRCSDRRQLLFRLLRGHAGIQPCYNIRSIGGRKIASFRRCRCRQNENPRAVIQLFVGRQNAHDFVGSLVGAAPPAPMRFCRRQICSPKTRG